MKVIDHEEHSWFFLENGNEYLINVCCNNSAAYFTMLIKLNEEELNTYHTSGRQFLKNFSRKIQFYALTEYQDRNITAKNEEISRAINEWRKN